MHESTISTFLSLADYPPRGFVQGETAFVTMKRVLEGPYKSTKHTVDTGRDVAMHLCNHPLFDGHSPHYEQLKMLLRALFYALEDNYTKVLFVRSVISYAPDDLRLTGLFTGRVLSDLQALAEQSEQSQSGWFEAVKTVTIS